MKKVKSIIIITVFILLVIPLSISIFMGNRKQQVTNQDNLVVMEANNAEKIQIDNINDGTSKVFIYSTVFASLTLMGMIYFFVASKKA